MFLSSSTIFSKQQLKVFPASIKGTYLLQEPSPAAFPMNPWVK